MQPSFRAVGQTHAEWQICEKLENKRQMYGSQASHAISLVYKIQFMLISSRHIFIRSILFVNYSKTLRSILIFISF